MRASRRLKSIMAAKNIKINAVAKTLGKSPQTIYNTFQNDEKSKRSGMTFEIVEEMANALGCDVIFRDRETGKEY